MIRKNSSAYCPSLSGDISLLTRNVITLPSLFHTAVSRIVFSLIKGVAATPRLNCKQDADRNAQTDRSVCEIKIYSNIYVLMTDFGLIAVGICGKT